MKLINIIVPAGWTYIFFPYLTNLYNEWK